MWSHSLAISLSGLEPRSYELAIVPKRKEQSHPSMVGCCNTRSLVSVRKICSTILCIDHPIGEALATEFPHRSQKTNMTFHFLLSMSFFRRARAPQSVCEQHIATSDCVDCRRSWANCYPSSMAYNTDNHGRRRRKSGKFEPIWMDGKIPFLTCYDRPRVTARSG